MPSRLFLDLFCGREVEILPPEPTLQQRAKRMNDTIAMNDRAPSNDQIVVDVSQDWESASDFQQRFMHQTVRSAEGITYSARCRQLRAIGGDYYDFMPLAQNRLAFA